ncbi:glycosyltransferase [Mycobacterium sp. P7213]|uniref:glycosyltransferase n=1 Tax=Mycobacterium sp. P7213 TaxID=2478465 RepID=UPI001F14B190|nr:glycosyltransferase [Mycobacterium sp. P7213]
MSDPVNTPTICLNMIVRDEAHIIAEVLSATAPYISAWVIVDTGSQDGTPQVIRDHMAALGIPGELYERPWRNFGHNRTEALTLAQGRCDYILVIDADDTIVGTPDFTGLDADIYELRIRQEAVRGWRPQLFRDGLPVRYVGVVHEYVECDEDHVISRLDRDFAIESRRLGARNLDPQKYARDRDLLLAEVERNPEDSRSVFYLAQSCFDLEDYAAAVPWYERRTQMGGYDEEVYFSLYRKAGAMEVLGEPWPEVQAAYLRAWEFRPTRAEPLYCLAFAYRSAGRYQLGHLFARQAEQIRCPTTTFGSMRGSTTSARPTSARCARRGWATTTKRSRCAGAWWRAPTFPTTSGSASNPTETFRFRPCLRQPRATPKRWCTPWWPGRPRLR